MFSEQEMMKEFAYIRDFPDWTLIEYVEREAKFPENYEVQGHALVARDELYDRYGTDDVDGLRGFLRRLKTMMPSEREVALRKFRDQMKHEQMFGRNENQASLF